MVEADMKKRKVQNWYNVVQDRVKWRRVVHGEKVSPVRGVRKQQDETEGKTLDELGLRCPKCGKVYRNNKGGFYARHVASCEAEGAEKKEKKPVVREERRVVDSGGGLKCPKCGKKYQSNVGGWYKKHINKCGSSQEFVQ